MTTIDPERQTKAKEYARISRRLWLVDTTFSAVYALAWLFFGWTTALRTWATSITSNEWLIVPVYVLVFGAIYFILDLPLSYYSGFVLPHRFDQSTQAFKDWIIDQLKGMAVGLPIGLIMLELLYLVLRVSGGMWWLWATVALLVVNVLLANLAPVLIMPIFNKFVPLGDEHKELADRLMKLAENANTKVQGVFKFDMSRRTKSANAALTGMGNTRRIILGDTLINEFSPDEIEVVLAHELGHQVHRDIPFLMAFSGITTVLGFYLISLIMNWALQTWNLSGVSDVAAFPVLILLIGVYSLLLMPIENGVVRWRERMADEYALQSTGKKEAYISAFVRLANQNLGEMDPEKWVVFLFYNHPPLGERIAKAKNWK
ncbi:MAG TPA: M48 family metallopeptidase [Anaerolineales bacterium]